MRQKRAWAGRQGAARAAVLSVILTVLGAPLMAVAHHAGREPSRPATAAVVDPIDRIFEERASRARPASTTTTEAPPPNSTPLTTARPARPRRVTGAAPRSTTTTSAAPARPAAISSPAPDSRDPGFWRRLANCESSTGRGGNGGGYFQMVGHGYRPGLTYEEQLALAQAWATKIHPREGTTAGWPTCWARALRG